jgi:16S rRNA (guanine(966)-N(2))-methyltransferase RsmD
MRVITGKYRGRKFYPPENIPTRPTTDFAKTGLFNILNNHIDFVEVSYLDLFAGTGSLSYEFASRGCEHIICVDQDMNCANFIKKMIQEWKITGMQVVRSDVFSFINQCRDKFDIIFAGPPYKLSNIADIPDIIFEKGLVKDEGWFILETSPEHDFSKHPRLFDHRKYGDTNFHFFR